MGNSLFEQMKKAGLVDKKKAEKAKRHQYEEQKKKQKPKKGTAEQPSEAKLLAQKAQAEKTERDRQINQQQKEQAERKAIAAQIIQLIETHRVQDQGGDIAYNFTDAQVVKRIYVSEQGVKLLTAGHLAIAKLGEGYALVPMAVAQKIKQRDPQCIIIADHSAEPVQDEDDPYADYTIPDDLMW